MPDPVIRPIRNEAEFQQALEVRIRVFVTEQHGPLADEPDAWDPQAQHFIVQAQGKTVGTARLYQPYPGTAKIGRVALLPEYRGRGWGARLLQTLLQAAQAQEFTQIILDAQVHAQPFYTRLGFLPEGEEFLDAGIPHIRMRYTSQSAKLKP